MVSTIILGLQRFWEEKKILIIIVKKNFLLNTRDAIADLFAFSFATIPILHISSIFNFGWKHMLRTIWQL